MAALSTWPYSEDCLIRTGCERFQLSDLKVYDANAGRQM